MKGNHNTTFGIPKENPSDIESIRTYLHLYRGEDVVLDDAVCRDINLDEIFCYADRCLTPVGELLLYDRFRQMKRSRRLADDEDDISKIREDGEFRARIETALGTVNGKRGLSVASLLNMQVRLAGWHKFAWLIPVVECILLILMLTCLPPAVAIVFALAAMTFNVFVHYANKSYVDLFIRPLIQLDQLRQSALRLTENDRFNDLQGIKRSIRNISRLSGKLRIFSLNGLLESDVMVIFYGLVELIKTLVCIEPVMTCSILRKIDDVSKDSRVLIEYIGGWDVLYSTASFRTWMDSCGSVWSVPEFVSEKKILDARDIYHPLIKDCVPNSIRTDRSVIITGSNMSGKSSFIKTIAVNIVTSYAMNMSFSARISLPECRINTVMTVSDDLDEGKSYYMAEALRIKAVIDRCTSPSDNLTDFVFIDEIFKGTNTVERVSIADAVIRYLSALGNTVAIVSTHDIELAKGLEESLDTYHFNETVDSEKIRFSYRLTPGVVYTRNAISLLRLCGYPESILRKAEENASARSYCYHIKQ